MNTRSTPNHVFRLAACAALIIAVLASCGMPFEWSGKMPDSWGEPGNEAPDSHEDPAPGGDGSADPGPNPEPAPADPQVMTVRGPSFTLAWDAGDSSVASFRVYRREHGASVWELLEPQAAEPQITVNEGDLPYGTYEFAVSSVCPEGQESDLHHSFDDTADPQPWVLEWIAG